MTVDREQLMDKIVALTKRRGFVFPSSEIYGGLSGFYDYGPYGVALKRAIRDLWWRHMVELRDDVVGLESTLIMPSEVWAASGHLTNFVDPLRQCLGECKRRWRADQVTGPQCPACGGQLSESRMFNLMFKTFVGPAEDSSSIAYLRPETAQGMFADFKNVLNSARVKVPFGIAQQGRAFRNEIAPGNFLFRLREFELMEMEFFVKPGQDDSWFGYWRKKRMEWYQHVLGIQSRHLRYYDHPAWTLSHYSKMTTDIEYKFPFGWGELEGIANRTDYDLAVHQLASRVDLTYLDPQTNERYLPWVIEPAVSTERLFITVLIDAYDEDIINGETRVVLRLDPKVAPVQVAIVPLSKKENLSGIARQVKGMLQGSFRVEYDETGGNIGRRYRRQDEIGTPFCLTVDFETLEDDQVTIRERDTTQQERVPITGVMSRLTTLIAGRSKRPRTRVDDDREVELTEAWATGPSNGVASADFDLTSTTSALGGGMSFPEQDPARRLTPAHTHGTAMTYRPTRQRKGPHYRRIFATGSTQMDSAATAEQLELPVEWK
jgi:glycyl-tRNA synthetase